MIRSYIFKEDIEKRYFQEFNRYAINIIYGDNLLIGDEIEAEYKDGE